ncbi:hypothetical protein [Paenibacillus sp. CECT 9249]|uniref:hypothetical protein n=1 Tax=Paenibacillus sp. CECT 9249 TaxID=2845385 RepID=UPI001E5EE1F3|nr:hypothetical protein [Paenibacillus sp. CECT 9249]
MKPPSPAIASMLAGPALHRAANEPQRDHRSTVTGNATPDRRLFKSSIPAPRQARQKAFIPMSIRG